MEISNQQILDTLKRIESKIDNFEGFYTPTKDELNEIKKIETEISSGEYTTLEELEAELRD